MITSARCGSCAKRVEGMAWHFCCVCKFTMRDRREDKSRKKRKTGRKNAKTEDKRSEKDQGFSQKDLGNFTLGTKFSGIKLKSNLKFSGNKIKIMRLFGKPGCLLYLQALLHPHQHIIWQIGKCVECWKTAYCTCVQSWRETSCSLGAVFKK